MTRQAVTKTFGVEYPWRDGTYVLPVKAYSADEAMERVRQAANLGKCFTPLGMEPLAINARWYANTGVWLRNAFWRD